jgi:hypothetical protein
MVTRHPRILRPRKLTGVRQVFGSAAGASRHHEARRGAVRPFIKEEP